MRIRQSGNGEREDGGLAADVAEVRAHGPSHQNTPTPTDTTCVRCCIPCKQQNKRHGEESSLRM